MSRVAVIGAGSWGTALSIVAARARHDVRIWSRNVDVVRQINFEHLNRTYFARHSIPETVCATDNLEEAIGGAEVLLLAAPSHATREILLSMKPHIEASVLFISATKGIEIETGKRMSEVLADVLGERFRQRFVALSGPSFSDEVAAGQPTAVVAAGENRDDTLLVQKLFSFENLRVYANDDLIGTELGGATKNVMAIAAGMVAGLGLGTNSVAALITRGLAEMTRLAVSEGARVETLMGLAGLGDLVLTCTGSLSRNRFVGQELGRGRKVEEILSEMREVAEGVKTAKAVKRLAEKFNVEMPITEEVNAVIYDGKSAEDAARALMTRPLRMEF